MAGTEVFTGLGQPGNWSDPMNWAGDVAPTWRSIVLVPTNAVLDGVFTARQVMFLGAEQVTINGTLNTLSEGLCKSFMVCAHAVATFTPTSTLNDRGGLVVGKGSVGTLIAQSDGTQHATLNTVSVKLGQLANGVGNVTIDGARWADTQDFYVGLAGQGTLDVLDGGTISVGTSFVVGRDAGATGAVSLASGATIDVAGYAKIGGGSPGAVGGIGTMSVGANSVFSVGSTLKITSGSALSLSGGTVTVADPTLGLQVWGGATVAGFGTLSSTAGGISDAGSISSLGGTLTLDGAVSGKGHIVVGADSTMVLNTTTIGKVSISFAGSGGTLDLAHGVTSDAVISGFGTGDSILMAGVNEMDWNGSTDVLKLYAAGPTTDTSTAVSTIQFAGSFAADPFTMTLTHAGALISLRT